MVMRSESLHPNSQYSLQDHGQSGQPTSWRLLPTIPSSPQWVRLLHAGAKTAAILLCSMITWPTAGLLATLLFRHFPAPRFINASVYRRRVIQYREGGGCMRSGRPSNPIYLGDYPKFGLWPMPITSRSTCFLQDNITFNGVRVFHAPRNSMISTARGARTRRGTRLVLHRQALGDTYSLEPATFRTGNVPPAGTPEYFPGH